MPKNILTFRVFLASPEDVAIERRSVKRVVDELNVIYSNRGDVKLDLITWENNVYPAIGKDAQAVINSQINDEYDIFIGLMWSRLGSPTSRSESGTKEEFDRALSRYQDDNRSVSIMIYFKIASIPFLEIIPEQVQKVKEFRSQLESLGVLYKQFSDVEEFEALLRVNLQDVVYNFQKLGLSESHLPLVVKPLAADSHKPENQLGVEDEKGMFEYMDSAINEFKGMAKELHNITGSLGSLNASIDKRTKKLEEVNKLTPDVKQREGRKVMDSLAQDLIRFNGKVETALPKMSQHFSQAMLDYGAAIAIYKSFAMSKEERERLAGEVLGLQKNVKDSLPVFEGMKIAVQNSPALTAKYTKAKRETVIIIDGIIREFNTYINITDDIAGNISEEGESQIELQ